MKKALLIAPILFLITASYALAVPDKATFIVESSYDLSGRSELKATLIKTTPKVYFYVDEMWWNSLASKDEANKAINSLAEEFETHIYPLLTSNFGYEWNPGIDRDPRITILIHPMKEEAGGYFSTKDEYPKIQLSTSNEREMIYVNSGHIGDQWAKVSLAHEFLHMISFNQKDNNYGFSEDTWLNELRAEYTSTLLGYDDSYKGSNLEKKVQIFQDNPNDSLIAWSDKKEDYGSVSVFGRYLVDHYGIKILSDTMNYPSIGIYSLNAFLKKNGFKEDFSQIFLNWTIANFVNDCNYGDKYCYLNKNLKNLYVNPQINFLPTSGETTLTITDVTQNFSGNWYKIIGGNGSLKLRFNSSSNFKLSYITKTKDGNFRISFLDLKSIKEINISNFGKDTVSLTIMPIINEGEANSFYQFLWTASTTKQQEDNPDEIAQLLLQIENLKKQIAQLQAMISDILNANSCQVIKADLYFGIKGNQEVRCLQSFLKKQGVYPSGLVTGNFLSLTKSAVIAFQVKYSLNATGVVDGFTKDKVNQLLK